MKVAGKVALWLVSIPASLLVDLIGFVGAPFFVLAAGDEPWLPRWLDWWQTQDNDLDGDLGHMARWKGYPVFVQRVAWIWRNNGYGFNATVLKAKTRGPVTVKGDPAVSNRPLREGLVIRTTPEGYWQLYFVRAYTDRLCVRINLGWKIWGETDHPNFGSFVCTPGLAMAYERGN